MSEPELDSGAKTLGEFLKSVREAKGVPVEEASAVTKIGKSYLVAIEEGDFDKLPNAAYLKGFLRLYANYLGLSAAEVIARYEQTLPAAAPHPEPHHQPSTMAVERVKFAGPRRWAIPLLLLCLVVLATLFFSEGEERTVKRTPPPAPHPVARVVVPPQPVLAPRSSVTVAPALSPSAAQSPAAAPQTPLPAATDLPVAPKGEPKRNGVILKLRFTQDSWLSITIDDAISQRYDLKAGDIIEWKGARSFTLDLGDGGAVDGEFNGKPLKALGERGKPAHVELKGE